MGRTGKTIDLHIHSRGSTGKCSVAEIASQAMLQNPDGMVLAITDHDSFALTKPEIIGKVRLLPAIELTSIHDENEIHLIFIYPEGLPDDCAVQKLLDSMDRSRYTKVVLDMVNEKKVTATPLTEEDILACNPGNAGYLRAPNFADAFVEMGICKNRDSAMDRYFGKWAPNRINHLEWNEYPTMQQALEAAVADRAIIILAHPFVYYKKDPVATEDLVRTFRNLVPKENTAGLEVYYKKACEHSDTLNTWAEKYSLFASVGSDYKNARQSLSQGDMELWDALYRDWKEKR